MLLDRLQFFLGSNYQVKKLDLEQAKEVWQLQVQDPAYHQVFQAQLPELVEIEAEMELLPAGADKSQKFYFGFYQADELVAIVDLVLDYPKINQAWLGMIMVTKQKQGQGHGQKIMQALQASLKREGYKKLQLANAKALGQASQFFTKLDFVALATLTSQTKRLEEIEVDLLAKNLG